MNKYDIKTEDGKNTAKSVMETESVSFYAWSVEGGYNKGRKFGFQVAKIEDDGFWFWNKTKFGKTFLKFDEIEKGYFYN